MKNHKSFWCWLGWHRWHYTKSGLEKDRYRQCRLCGREEMFDDYAGKYQRMASNKETKE
jgi:hypothetical protein